LSNIGTENNTPVKFIPEEHPFEPTSPSPDDSPTREPIIDIAKSDADIDEPDVSPVEGLVEPSFSIGLIPLSPSGTSKPLLVNKSSLIIYHLFTTLNFGNS
jgi:hypothetical protein